MLLARYVLFRSLIKAKGKVMNTGIRRILCATDLSGNCDHIYNCAMKLAGERGAGLMVIHVISQRSIKAAKALAYFLNESQNDVVKEKAYSALQRMKEQLGSFLKKEIKDHPEYPGLVEHMLVYPGKVAEEIVEKANRFGCEAIVLGSHSPNFLTAFFPCGTTKNVLKQTKKPVFLVSVKKGEINIATYNKSASHKEGLPCQSCA
jgi:nucleotide-binding universal stress UspA family protein